MSEETIQSICAAVMKCTHEVYPRYMQEVNNIDIDYFDLLRDREVLPEELNLMLKSQVVDKLRTFAHVLLRKTDLRATIEAFQPTSEEMEEVRRRVHSNGVIRALDNGDTDLTDKDLEKLLANARRRTLWERVTQTNKDDVLQFHHALQEKTYEECKDAYYTVLDEYLKEM